MANGVAGTKRVGKALDRESDLIGEGGQGATVGKLQLLVVGKIELQLDKRRKMEQLITQTAQLRRDAAAQLTQSEILLRLGLRSDEIGHRLRLGEIHLAVKERALREFARTRHAATRIDKPSQ